MGRTRVAITLGDPAGIGPEIVLRAAHDPSVAEACDLILVGPASALRRAASSTGLSDDISHLNTGGAVVEIRDTAGGELPQWGEVSDSGGGHAARALEEAVRLVRDQDCQALVTAPLHKEALRLAGLPWTGHTPYLAHLDGAAEVFMVFRTPDWSVVLVTDHVPLRDVPRLLTTDRVVAAVRSAIRLLDGTAQTRMRVALAGLNPHAGEGGLLGREDEEVLAPAAVRLCEGGLSAVGPLPGDTVYRRACEGEFDLVAAPYHDQGLVAVKTQGLGRSVHFTAGLSFVRASVDHGTAFDIAGTGRADARPLIDAILAAVELYERRGGPR